MQFREKNQTVIAVVTVFETPPNNLHKGVPMLFATASITAISTPALAFNCKKEIFNKKYNNSRLTFRC